VLEGCGSDGDGSDAPPPLPRLHLQGPPYPEELPQDAARDLPLCGSAGLLQRHAAERPKACAASIACRAMQQAAVETAGIRMAGMSGGAARRTGHRCAV
jgi:hypothetical protein